MLQRDWRHGPPVYSDINFILLGIVIERVTGQPLNQQPLQAGFTFAPDPDTCAATEFCRWRERMLRGEVHDENAFALGGAAGHAGLFGAIDPVLDFAAAILNGTALRPETISLMRTRQSAQRALGWEMKYDGWSGGALCSDDTIGHTGFTGTGLWIDFRREIAWSLLTNRVHPTRHVSQASPNCARPSAKPCRQPRRPNPFVADPRSIAEGNCDPSEFPELRLQIAVPRAPQPP